MNVLIARESLQWQVTKRLTPAAAVLATAQLSPTFLLEYHNTQGQLQFYFPISYPVFQLDVFQGVSRPKFCMDTFSVPS